MRWAEIKTLGAVLTPEPGQKWKLAGLCALSALLAVLEAVGVGSIAPLVALLQSPERFAGTGLGRALQWLAGTSETKRLVLVLGVVVLLLFLLKAVVALINGFLAQRYAQAFYTSLSSRLLEGYMRMPYEQVARTNSAVLIRNVINEVRLIVDHIVLQSLSLLSEGLVVLLILLALFYVSPLAATALMVLTLALLAALGLVMRLAGRHYGTARESAEAELIKLAQSAISGLRELRLAGTGDLAVERYRAVAARFSRAATMLAFIGVMPRITLEALAMAAVLGALVFVMLSESTSSLPVLAMFVGAGYRLLPALNRIYASGAMFFYVLPSLVKLAPSLTEAVAHARRAPIAAAPGAPLEILSAHQLTFRYEPDAPPVLVDASLEVRRGEMIGIVGPSGAGKTTLVNLLLGLLPVTGGSVRVNGDRIAAPEDVARLHAQVAYVAQSVFIADDTLLHNIVLGERAESVDRARLALALRIARLDALVAELPQGLETGIGERGARLSGGQVQRIGIARAIYLNRPLLVLDEATSALDVDTEREVLAGIGTHLDGKAVIAISHRYVALAQCTRIYRLEAGRVSGPIAYADLARGLSS